MKVLRILLVLLATPVAARPPDFNDYPALFEEHADEIVTSTRTDGAVYDTLKLPGPVEVTKWTEDDGEVVYRGMDLSGQGLPVCGIFALVWFESEASVCPGLLSEPEIAILDATIVRFGTFIGENSYPLAAPDAVVEAFRAMAADVLTANGEAGKVCSLKAEDAHRYVELFVADEATISEMLAVPRLPVSNPSCM